MNETNNSNPIGANFDGPHTNWDGHNALNGVLNDVGVANDKVRAVICAIGAAVALFTGAGACIMETGPDEPATDLEDTTVAAAKSALSITYPDGLYYCGDGTLGTVAGSLYYKTGGKYVFSKSCAGGCAVNQSGVSDACLMLGPWTSDALLNIAKGAAGNSAASAITATPAATWITDAGGGTGQDIVDATAYFHNWRRANPTATVPQSVRDAMAAKFDALACGSSASPTAMTATDRASMVGRIIARYAGSAPSSNQGALDLLGVRAQCKETVDRWVRGANLTSKSYSTYIANGWVKKYSDIRAGNIAIWKDSAHIAVVIAVTRDASGVLLSVKLAESNWATGFSCPPGALPWSRVVRTDRVIYRSDLNVGSGGAYKIVEIKS